MRKPKCPKCGRSMMLKTTGHINGFPTQELVCQAAPQCQGRRPSVKPKKRIHTGGKHNRKKRTTGG